MIKNKIPLIQRIKGGGQPDSEMWIFGKFSKEIQIYYCQAEKRNKCTPFPG